MAALDRARFFVIEGVNGIGKTTQLDCLSRHLSGQGRTCRRLKFPRYNQPGAHFVNQYLAGNYGQLGAVSHYEAGVIFALERWEIKQLLGSMDPAEIVLVDRYIGSNLAYQAAHLDQASQRRSFFDWLLDFEFQKLAMPQAEANFVLTGSADLGRQRLYARESQTRLAADIHKADDDYQARVGRVFQEICQLFPDKFIEISSQDDQGRPLTIDQVADKIQTEIGRYLI